MSNLNDFLPNTSPALATHTVSSYGSTDSGNPTALPSNVDLILFDYGTNAPSSTTYFALADGTTAGQKLELISKAHTSPGSNHNISLTYFGNKTNIGLSGNSERNQSLVWTGTAWAIKGIYN